MSDQELVLVVGVAGGLSGKQQVNAKEGGF